MKFKEPEEDKFTEAGLPKAVEIQRLRLRRRSGGGRRTSTPRPRLSLTRCLRRRSGGGRRARCRSRRRRRGGRSRGAGDRHSFKKGRGCGEVRRRRKRPTSRGEGFALQGRKESGPRLPLLRGDRGDSGKEGTRLLPKQRLGLKEGLGGRVGFAGVVLEDREKFRRGRRDRRQSEGDRGYLRSEGEGFGVPPGQGVKEKEDQTGDAKDDRTDPEKELFHNEPRRRCG